MPEGSRRSDATRKIAWQEANTRVCTIRREGAGETNVLRTVEQNESQMQVRSVAGSENNSAECFVGPGRRRVQSVRGQEDRTSRQVGQRGNQQNDRSLVVRIVDGNCTLYRPFDTN